MIVSYAADKHFWVHITYSFYHIYYIAILLQDFSVSQKKKKSYFYMWQTCFYDSYF